jgi:hypothetical protein
MFVFCMITDTNKHPCLVTEQISSVFLHGLIRKYIDSQGPSFVGIREFSSGSRAKLAIGPEVGC